MPPASRLPLLIAHRGGPRYAPENTLAAFRHALAAGVDGVECDVHLSRDGQVVIIHDEHLERTTNGRGPVSGLTLAELQALDAGRGEPVPSLRQMLDLTRPSGCRLLVELKSPALYPGIEARVLEALAEQGDLGRAVIMSFDHASLARVRALDPQAQLCALVGGWSVDWRALPPALLAPPAPGGAEGAGPQSIGPMAEAALLHPTLITRAHQLGLKVYAWFGLTENPLLYRLLRARGVDSLTGNDPLQMVKTLRK